MGRSQGKGKGAKNDGNWKKDSGGGGGRYVTAKQAAFIDTLIEQQDKNEEEKRLSKMKKKIEADIKKAAKAGNKGLNWINLSLPFFGKYQFSA